MKYNTTENQAVSSWRLKEWDKTASLLFQCGMNKRKRSQAIFRLQLEVVYKLVYKLNIEMQVYLLFDNRHLSHYTSILSLKVVTVKFVHNVFHVPFGQPTQVDTSWLQAGQLSMRCWNFNGYSDLSPVEGIVGGWEGEWEERGVQVSVKITDSANVGRRWIMKRIWR